MLKGIWPIFKRCFGTSVPKREREHTFRDFSPETRILLVFLILIFTCAVGNSVFAEKIIRDPNAPTAKVETSSGEKPRTDPNLAQKVTIECVNVRLHTALEQISAKTGVIINCGKDTKDWPVRDLPIVVCVKDMPLSVLLKTIADVMHLHLTSSLVDGVWYHRIWRDLALEKELADYKDYVQACQTAEHARLVYDWNIYCKVKDIPDEELSGLVWDRQDMPIIKDISDILSSLDPKAKEKLLSGESVILRARCADTEMQKKITSAFRDLHQRWDAGGISMEDAVSGSKSLIIIRWGPEVHVIIPNNNKPFDVNRNFHVERFEGKYGLPPRPEYKPPKPLGSPALSSKYPELDTKAKDGPDLLQTKVKLEKPEDKKHPTYAEALAAFSAASGYSVVAQDFPDYGIGLARDKVPGLFGREITAREVLDLPRGTIGWEAGVSHVDGPDWYLDEADKMILGVEHFWTERIENMVPESLIASMTAKVRGQGVELDDLEPIVGLTRNQLGEWFALSDELRLIEDYADKLTEASLWQLYYSLTPADRRLAKSERGLSLAKHDIGQMREVFQCVSADARKSKPMYLSDEEPCNPDESYYEGYLTLADDDVFPSLTMQVTKQQWKDRPDKSIYILEIRGQKDGKTIQKQESLGFFPVYTPEREAEITKEKEKPQMNADKHR